jgi:hypothetical protein
MAGGVLQDAVASLARTAREAVAGGVALNRTVQFATQLRAAGRILSATGTADEAELATRLDAISVALRSLPAVAAPTGAPAPPGGTLSRPPADSVAVKAPAAAQQAAVAAAVPAAPAGAEEAADLPGSWIRYERYVTTLGLAEASLDELLAGPPADPATPAAVPAAAAEAPAALATAAAELGEEIVDISSLCYRGRDALERAVAIRSEVLEALRDPAVDHAALTELIEEIFDLVELGLENEH